MDGLAIITGIGITVFILLYFAFNLEKKHQLLQVLTIGYALFLLVLIPSTTIELDKDCGINSSGQYFCYYSNGTQATFTDVNGSEVGNTFFESYLYYVWAFGIYLFIYFSASIFLWFQKRLGAK